MSAVGAPVLLEVPMTTPHTYITTTIPYVNARPHLGFALELVQADVLAWHRRARGDRVRLQTGTDDNSLKNVLAAEAAGVGVQEFVDRNAAAFVALAEPLSLSVDDVIRTSRDPRHRVGVERFWRACAAAGDLYREHYAGLYCVGYGQDGAHGRRRRTRHRNRHRRSGRPDGEGEAVVQQPGPGDVHRREVGQRPCHGRRHGRRVRGLRRGRAV